MGVLEEALVLCPLTTASAVATKSPKDMFLELCLRAELRPKVRSDYFFNAPYMMLIASSLACPAGYQNRAPELAA